MNPQSLSNLKASIEKILVQQLTHFVLKGKGDCNYAYYTETADGKKYIIKIEREQKETQDQNDLIAEGNIIRALYDTQISVPVPHVIHISDKPKFYIYEYIEGELMRGVWPSLTEEEKIDLCHSLGRFHAEIGMKISKELAHASGVEVNERLVLRPRIIEDEYNRLIGETDVPEEFKNLSKEAKKIFDGTITGNLTFQFIHNDSHPDNIIIKDKKISGIIDFGDAEYGEVSKEFSRYFRDLPDYVEYIISSYEEISGNTLSRKRIISNAFISGLPEIVDDYRKGSDDRIRAEKSVELYKRLLQ